jgi:deoxyadenosine/deoxycytidine kinase
MVQIHLCPPKIMFIAIAGNIGSGKTNLTKTLVNCLKFQPCLEEFFASNPYLERFYQDKKTWAFHSQLFFLGQSIKNQREILKRDIPTIQDRSMYENAEVFARSLYKDGYISEDEWQIYWELYENAAELLTPPDVIVYLQADVETLIARIKKRGRMMEAEIEQNRGYITRLNEMYEDWANNFKLCPVLKVPIVGTDFRNRPEEVGNLILKIEDVIGKKLDS